MSTIQTLLSLTTLFLLLSFTLADLPVHCEFPQITGKWKFTLTPQVYDVDFITSKCEQRTPLEKIATDFATFSTMEVVLSGPNHVQQTKPETSTGTFTMVYDQGFQIWLNGNEYFANFNFSSQGSKVTSYCHETLTGWYNTDEVASKKWGCFRAVKVQEDSDNVQTVNVHEEPLSVASNELYQAPEGFVKRINTEQNEWVAHEYPELWGKMTLAEMRAKGGVPLAQIRLDANERHMQMMRQLQQQDGIAMAAQIRKLPDNFSWRSFHNQSFVPDVRSQGSCGSCYAFGTTGSAMGRYRVQTQNARQVNFSPQDLMSCYNGEKPEGIFNQRCEGGFPFLVAKRARQVGLNTEECFPYAGADRTCSAARCHQQTFVKDYGYLGGYYGATTEEMMMESIYNDGPLAVNVQATQGWFHYKSGIYREPKFASPDPKFVPTNHIVFITAYGVDEATGTKYWELQNSWGAGWGENGYMRIVRGENMNSIEAQVVGFTLAV